MELLYICFGMLNLLGHNAFIAHGVESTALLTNGHALLSHFLWNCGL